MNYSHITDDLLIGTTPRSGDYVELFDLGVRLVINMRFLLGRPPYRQMRCIQYMRLRTVDHPLFPIPEESLLLGARRALQVIAGGGRVYAHCSRGRHRSVAMGAAILVAQGSSPENAIQLIKQQREVADPEAPHIRPRIAGFADLWHKQHS